MASEATVTHRTVHGVLNTIHWDMGCFTLYGESPDPHVTCVRIQPLQQDREGVRETLRAMWGKRVAVTVDGQKCFVDIRLDNCSER